MIPRSRFALPFLGLWLAFATASATAETSRATARAVTRVIPADGATPVPGTPPPAGGVASPAGEPQLVRVALGGAVTPEALLEAGLDVIEVHRGSHCVLLEWPGDGAALERLGARTEVLDPHPGLTQAERARVELSALPRPPGRRVASATGASGVFRAQTLPAFGFGSMFGFWVLDEIKMKLDDLVASDANDVVADKLDTLGYTLLGRPIWGLKLGKSVTGPDTRPVAFYNSLTHAREPESMQVLFYFVDDLLSRYGTDPTATYLLDHRVIYLVPLVNPDGYWINVDHFTSTGTPGYHRKNARDINGNGVVDYATDGVDINRNYGYQWGMPGGSSVPAEETYRGGGPFSEPETQAERDIVAALQPKSGLSFHTFGDLYIHPQNFTTVAAPDSLKFYEWSDGITAGLGYQSGQATRILYQVSGEFTDWCYNDNVVKPSFYIWTPEVGRSYDGFWPTPSRMVPLARENLRPCYYVASIAGPYVQVESFSLLEGALNQGSIAHLVLRARNKGISGLAGPDLTATLGSISAGAHVIQGAASLPTLGSLESGDLLPGGNFLISADDTVTLGRTLCFQVNFTAPDGFFSRDTIRVYCGTPTVLLADDASLGLVNWSAGNNGWGVESDEPAHPGPFFADSPTGSQLYTANANQSLTSKLPLDFSKAKHAYLSFDGRWDFGPDYDCGLVEANPGGHTWTPLAGSSSASGSGLSGGKQPLGQPVYAGAGRLWRRERVDLSSLAGPAGTAVGLRFRVATGNTNPARFDGLRVDSIVVVTFDPATQPSPVAVDGGLAPAALELAAPAPNPARGAARLSFALPRASRASLEVLDVQGRRVRSLASGPLAAGRYAFGWDLRDGAGRAVAPGIYLIRFSDGTCSLTRPLAVLD